MVRRPLMSNAMIAERYCAGVTIGELASLCRCTPNMIRRILDLQGASLRSYAVSDRLRREDALQRRARIRAGLGL